MKKIDEIILTQEQIQALKELKRRLSNEFNIGQVILFGSVARVEADNESDTDLLILTDYPMTRFERHKITDMIFEVNLFFGTNFSTLVIDRFLWNYGPVSVLPFHEEVDKDGILGTKEEQRLTLIQYWWSKAEESLASAKREYDAKSYHFSMNRLYYAAFYAVSAILFEQGLSFKKHTGVRSAFHRNFIKSGLIESDYGKLYDRLFEDRQEGDYIAFVSFQPDSVDRKHFVTHRHSVKIQKRSF